MYIGSSVFSTPTTKNNPPMFADFGCSRAALNLNRCRYPEGRLTSVLNCGPNVIGIQCVRKYVLVYYNIMT